MFQRHVGWAAAAMICCGLLQAQTPAPPLTFEVAAIKTAPPLDAAKIMSGKLKIGMTVNAGRVDIGNLSLADLIRMAYKVKPYQITGPDWMPAQRFDIQAKMPEGATKEQVPEMLQALLAERFKLAIHRDSKEHAVYALVVGKGGAKMKESEPEAPVKPAVEGEAPPAGPPGKGGMVVGTGEGQVRVNQSSDGKGTTISGGPMGQMKMQMVDGQMRMEFAKMSMERLAEMLSGMVDRPVVDMTELKGNFQVSLALSMEDLGNIARKNAAAAGMSLPMGGPGAGAGAGDASRTPSSAASAPTSSAFGAVQQLGLKLDSRKAPVEMIVIDHLEKTPTEN
jgi:uncharacterized protein (TIGR03435 family)